MADGDVKIDRELSISPGTGTRVDLFAVEDSSYPGGYYYHFQYYNRPRGEQILRYDNANDAHGVGPHHRHERGSVTGIVFEGLKEHITTFLDEVFEHETQ